jgi:hypothetical protein
MSTLREILTGITGVWDGTYSHFKTDGTLIEKYASHQETRLNGNDWFERIVYQREGEPAETLDFRATLNGDEMLFEDAKFLGNTIVVTPRILAFPYTWKDRPHLEILEIIDLVTDSYRTRLWQHFEHSRLVKTTLIEETRVPGGSVAIWE